MKTPIAVKLLPNFSLPETWTYDLQIPEVTLKTNLDNAHKFQINDRVAVTNIESNYLYDSPYVISGETDSAWILRSMNKESVFEKSAYKLELIKR